MWIYTFGSIVRGEIDAQSDADFVCISSPESSSSPVPGFMQRYSLDEIMAIFASGDLFAHHLHSESCLVHTTEGCDIIRDLGPPAHYSAWGSELSAFIDIVKYSHGEVDSNPRSVFHKGILYMGLRDMAMIYSYASSGTANFSKYAPYQVDSPLGLSRAVYEHLRSCRLYSTRAPLEMSATQPIRAHELQGIAEWADRLDGWRLDHAE